MEGEWQKRSTLGPAKSGWFSLVIIRLASPLGSRARHSQEPSSGFVAVGADLALKISLLLDPRRQVAKPVRYTRPANRHAVRR